MQTERRETEVVKTDTVTDTGSDRETLKTEPDADREKRDRGSEDRHSN